MSTLFADKNKIFILGLLSLVIIYSCVAHYKTTTDSFIAVKDAESIERGKNLVFNICAGCHLNHEVKTFIGNRLHDIPRFLGKVYSANLTHSEKFGVIPHYSDAELMYFFKTGISKDGRYIVYMLKPMLADEDINDIIIYLRSNDVPLAAADTSVGKTHLNVFGKIAVKLTGNPKPYIKGVSLPDENNPVSYGHYLVGAIGCYHCHTKRTLKLDYVNPERSKGFMEGGKRFKDPQGNRVYSYNLTPDKETGIGNFTKEDFRKAVREGIAPDSSKLRPPMGQFRSLTDKQVDAIYAYLQTLEPKHHLIKGH